MGLSIKFPPLRQRQREEAEHFIAHIRVQTIMRLRWIVVVMDFMVMTPQMEMEDPNERGGRDEGNLVADETII
jgi:Pyruvate/2-oxoacid:ferredoxin oxidoreductase gamma subunit